ncbi:Enhancer of polycomb-like protein 2 [Bienertia sinuspersici]
MPSVEMRRSTRVFVPKAKDGELVRVLRSGRRLWVESAEVKNRGTKIGYDWYPLINDSNNIKCKQHKINGWHNMGPTNDDDPMDVDDDKFVQESSSNESSDAREECKMMFKNVYSRKRKRLNVRDIGVDDSKKFGLHFVRRQRRRIREFCCIEKKLDDDEIEQGCIGGDHGLLMVVVESSCVGCCVFSSILNLILRYVSRERVGFTKLSEFLLSKPISPVFASSGIRFLRNHAPIETKGLCRIFGVRQLITMFTVDYMAAPHCFLHLHATMLFRSVCPSCLCWTDFDRKNESSDEPLPYINDQLESSLGRLVAPAIDELKAVNSVHSSPVAGKLSSRNLQSRVGVLTWSASKRRRRTLRSRRARNLLHFFLQKSSGSPVSNDAGLKKNAALVLSSAPKQELRRSVRKSVASELNVQNNTSPLGLSVDIDYSQCCFANVLVVEADKCYRVERAEVVLDVSSSNEWHLTVKKDGSTMYHFKVQREMRPGTTNRFTHAVIWAGDNGWKLEFPERKDWAVFKELYKVCGERNIVPTSPVVKIIPVPKVSEVTDMWEPPAAFKRPDSYIRTTSDELSRTLSRRTANYDMDSEDEEWLSNFNRELKDASNYVTAESFELMIDVFEKASYCTPNDVNDEKAAASLCLNLASVEVAEPVCRYWMKKRKQKRAPLNRVFQLNQPTRAQLVTKPVLRKKRSLKRQFVQPMQRGRGKNSTVLQVIAAEHNAAEELNFLRVQDTKASADNLVEVAIHKRHRAQFLMENADLAMYRATMALRIADAALESLDHDQAADHFLD